MMQPGAVNPFPCPSPLERVLLTELVRVAKACYDRGWSFGTAGNFSLRGQDGLIWQSPSGLNKGDLNPAFFIPVDLATAQVVGPLKVVPSLEMPVHLGAYRSVPEALCVVHTHPPNLVAASRSGQDLLFSGDEMQKALGSGDHLQTLRLPVLTNVTPSEMTKMAESTGAAIVPGVPMVVLAAHGVYAWGRTPLEALAYIEAAEFLCQTYAPQKN